jgi:Mrp family chromosome partitioning ATPase
MALAAFHVSVVAWSHREDGCNVSGGGRLVAACATLFCGAATLILALALAPDAPFLVLLVIVVAAAAGVALALRGSHGGDESAGSALAEAEPVDPAIAAGAALADADGRTFSIPLAPVGESLEPPREPSEPFQALARAVRASAPPHGLIQVTSPMAGEGKTTVATNLAAALAFFGDRVLLVDAHPDRQRAHLMLGTAPRLVSNGRPLREYVAPTHFANLDLFCAAQSETYGRVTLAAIWRDLAHQYDLTLIDTGGGLSRELPEPVERADLNILVARADHTPARLIAIARERLAPAPAIVVMNATTATRSRRSRPEAHQSGA